MGQEQYNFKPSTVDKRSASGGTSFFKLLLIILLISLPIVGYWIGTKQVRAPAFETVPLLETATSTAKTTASSSTEAAPTAAPAVAETSPEPKAAQSPTPTPPKQTQVSTPTVSGPTVLTVYIAAVTNDTISLDNIAIYEGDAAVTQMAADGLCDAARPKTCNLEEGFYYRNTDPTIRTYPLAANVDIMTWTGSKKVLADLKREAPSNTPYSVTLNSAGVVTIIKEIYKK